MRIDLLGDEWSSASDQPGYRWRRMRVAGTALGASLYFPQGAGGRAPARESLG